MIVDGKVDVTRYQPVSRLGYKDYAAIKVFELARPDKTAQTDQPRLHFLISSST